MEIKLDFTVINCDCGHSNSYTCEKCEKCGEDFSEFEPHIDPKMLARKEFMKPTFDLIESKKAERKKWFKKLRKGEESLIVIEDEKDSFSTIEGYVSRLNAISSRDIFEDIAIFTDSLTDDEAINEVEKFNYFISDLHDIMFEAERIQLRMIWKNINRRFISSARFLYQGYMDMIDAIVSINHEQALSLQVTGQEKIDFATNEINILNRILTCQNTMLNVDIFDGGEVNQSAIISMMYSGESTATDSIKKTNQLTRYYFMDLIQHDLSEENLIFLSPFMYLGTSVFDDEDYFRKIRVVTSLLDKAIVKDRARLKAFSRRYVEKFINALKISRDISTDFAFVYGNKPSYEMLMRYCMKWYKDLSEGVFKDVSRFVYFAMNIVNEKTFDDDDVLTWLGFGAIVGDFETQTLLKLNHLTEGVVKIVRHAEAHVDYEIVEKTIKLRNVIAREKTVNYETFTFDEFFDVTNKLAETVFAIICGIQLHLIDNSELYEDAITAIEKNEQNAENADMTSIAFGLNGIILFNQYYEPGLERHLVVEGSLNRDIERKDIGDTIFRSCAHSTYYTDDIDVIEFKLYDADGIFLGKVVMETYYVKKFIKDTSDFQNYYLLLAKLVANIDPTLNENVTNDRDMICLKSVATYLLDMIKTINHVFRVKEIKYNYRIKTELKPILHDLELLKRFVYLYREHSEDEIIFLNISMLVNQLDVIMNHIKSTGIKAITIGRDFANLKILTDTMVSYSDFAQGKISREEYLQGYMKRKPYLPKYLSANTPCPCGSGKKYKKCCKLLI